MVGSHGALREHYQRIALGRDDLKVLTEVEDVTDLLLSSDLFFFPSLNEGFGIVATEAAWAGLPIVSTNLTTLREAVPPAYHKFMFEPDDDRSAIASIQAISRRDLCERPESAEARSWLKAMTSQASIEQVAAPLSCRPGLQ